VLLRTARKRLARKRFARERVLTISGAVVSQCRSRPATVISSTVSDLDIVFSAITTTFLTVVDQSNTCTQIARPLWFKCGCQL